MAAVLLLFTAAAPPLTAKTIQVGVSGSAPFVTKEKDFFDGISLKIWRYIADENNINFNLKAKTFSPLDGIKAVSKGDLDVLIGPISITSTRVAIPGINFTQPYFFGRSGVLIPTTPPTIFSRLQVFLGRAVLSSVVVLIMVLLMVGVLIWLAERRRNQSQFPAALLPGVGSGMWFALVTLTTVGYGDKAPVTRLGRGITSIWMVISLIAVSSLTASLASALTLFLSGVTTNTITKPKDLAGKRVAVVQGTDEIGLAGTFNMKQVLAKDLISAVGMLANGEADALIFDRPAIRYHLKNNPNLQLKLAPFTLSQESYGFVSKTGNKLNMPMNVSILKMQSNGVLEGLTKDVLN